MLGLIQILSFIWESASGQNSQTSAFNKRPRSVWTPPRPVIDREENLYQMTAKGLFAFNSRGAEGV